MIKKLPVFFALIVLCSKLFAQSQRHALLIGVGEYASVEYASKPLNALKGVQMMRATLLDKGFSDDDIIMLTNADATRDGITRAFERLSLRVAPGDIAVFYFYGHGAQIQDDGEEEVDRLDEALVPYDGRRTTEKEHHNLVRDGDLGRWAETLRRRTGPAGQVLVLLDACHSGSGLRAATNKAQPDKHHLARPGQEDILAPFVAFYSSMPHQPSIEAPVGENERCALFTWAFCKAMQQTDSVSTYRGLFEQIALHIATRSRHQTPQIEGIADLLIFGGKVNPPLPYFRIATILDDRRVLLGAGLLHSLHPGTKVALFPPETRDTTLARPLAYGVVEENGTSLLESTVVLDRPVPESTLASAWVFAGQRRFAGYTLPLRLEVADPAQKAVIRGRLADMEALQLDVAPTPELALALDKGKLVLRSAGGAIVWEARYNADNPEPVLQNLQKTLGDYLQAQFLRILEFEGSPYRAEFTARTGKTPGAPPDPASLLTVRQHKDTVILKVVNRSAKPVYYTILDIDAHNAVQVLLPGAGRAPAEYRLEPGAESPPHRARFDAPGREVLKLILTPVPVDLHEAMASRGRSQHGGSFFETLFAETYWQNGKSRGPSGGYRGNEAGVETVVLEVIK